MRYFQVPFISHLSAVLFGLNEGLNQACSTPSGYKFTFYGYPDNSPPGPATAHNCGGRNFVAGGLRNLIEASF